MAQFDVCRVRGGGLIIDCQSDLLSSLPTRLVAPLRAKDASVIARLNPVFDIDGQELVMITQLVGAINARDIIDVVAKLRENDVYIIKSALDMLISGF